MKKSILISPNSFKECADSVTIANLIKSNLLPINNVELIMKPISDGGDGFLEVCEFYFGGEIIMYTVTTPFDVSKIDCPVLYNKIESEIYIESADILGLKVVPQNFRNPLKLSSKGLGELLIKIGEDAAAGMLKINTAYIGIGGTATIDLGMGMMNMLGLRMYDSGGKSLNVIPENFGNVIDLEFPQMKLPFDISLIIDVQNPLFGVNGGIRVFGVQKGANEEIISLLENNCNYLINLFNNNKILKLPLELSGAGGGLPIAFRTFLNSKLYPLDEFIFNQLNLSDYLNETDYLIIGEGAFDNQSLNGKGASDLIDKFHKKVKRIFLICGTLEYTILDLLPENVRIIQLTDYFQNKSESINRFSEGIEIACKQIREEINF